MAVQSVGRITVNCQLSTVNSTGGHTMPILTKRANKTPLGIYVHVPFCRSKCQYCDFYSLCTKEDKIIDGYLDAVCDHIKEAGELAPNYTVDTIYFGGGTPAFSVPTVWL